MVKSLANTVAKAESLISHCRARPSQMATQKFGSVLDLTGSDHVVPFDGPAAAGHALPRLGNHRSANQDQFSCGST